LVLLVNDFYEGWIPWGQLFSGASGGVREIPFMWGTEVAVVCGNAKRRLQGEGVDQSWSFSYKRGKPYRSDGKESRRFGKGGGGGVLGRGDFSTIRGQRTFTTYSANFWEGGV